MTSKNYRFVSILTTDDYLDGILVLKHSLAKTNAKYPFVLLVTPNISPKVLAALSSHQIDYITIEGIENPVSVADSRLKRWNFTYSKLNLFGLEQFDKIVYLDADMLILQNIDDLFEKPHMSAVDMGEKLPELATWNRLNTGLLVIEPSVEVFNDMLSKVGKIEKKVASPSDEDFLQAYYPDWANQKQLHLDSGYNMFSYYWKRYHQLYGYNFSSDRKPIKIVHYIGEDKPWKLYNSYSEMSVFQSAYQFLRNFKYPHLRHLQKANQLWFKQYGELTQ
jgi:glycogenin